MFCSRDGLSFSQKTPHTEDEIWGILGAFDLVLAPKSLLLTEEELKTYCRFVPLAEYSNEFGVALQKEGHKEKELVQR